MIDLLEYVTKECEFTKEDSGVFEHYNNVDHSISFGKWSDIVEFYKDYTINAHGKLDLPKFYSEFVKIGIKVAQRKKILERYTYWFKLSNSYYRPLMIFELLKPLRKYRPEILVYEVKFNDNEGSLLIKIGEYAFIVAQLCSNMEDPAKEFKLNLF